MRASSAISAIGLALLAVASPAWADGTVLILQLEGPNVPEPTVTALDTAMREEVAQVTGKRARVLPRPALDFTGLREATGCADASNSCLQAIGRTISATQVIRADLVGTAQRATLSITIVDVATGKTRTGGGELIEVAPDSAAELRYHMAIALGAKRELAPGKVALYVASAVGKLEGAEVFIDGVATKAPDLAEVAPGAHTVEVRQQGFEPFRWSGAIRPAKETRIGVTFTPARPPEPIVTAPPPPADPLVPETPAIDAAPPPAAVTTMTRVEPDDGPNYLVPGILGVATLTAAVVATIQGARVLGFESSHAEMCNVAVNRPAGCGEASSPGPTCTIELCDDARTAASMSTAFWVASGVLAAGAITSYLIVDHMADERSGVTGVLAPAPGGATLLIRY